MVLTRVAVALVELDITDGAGVSRIALTGVGGNTILTHTVVAWIWLAVIDVLLTHQTGETFSTFTIISVRSVDAFGSI